MQAMGMESLSPLTPVTRSLNQLLADSMHCEEQKLRCQYFVYRLRLQSPNDLHTPDEISKPPANQRSSRARAVIVQPKRSTKQHYEKKIIIFSNSYFKFYRLILTKIVFFSTHLPSKQFKEV